MRAAVKAAESAGEATWSQIITSPLLRSAEFAHEVAEARGLPIETWPRMREMTFGEWEGQATDTLWKVAP